MADADGIAHIPVLRHRRHVAPEDSPVVRQWRLTAAPVPAGVHRQTVTIRNNAAAADPASAVKSGGVLEQKWRVFPRPLPHCQLFSTIANELQLRGSSHLCIFPR